MCGETDYDLPPDRYGEHILAHLLRHPGYYSQQRRVYMVDGAPAEASAGGSEFPLFLQGRAAEELRLAGHLRALVTCSGLAPTEQRRAAGTLAVVEPYMTVLAREDPSPVDESAADAPGSDESISSEDTVFEE